MLSPESQTISLAGQRRLRDIQRRVRLATHTPTSNVPHTSISLPRNTSLVTPTSSQSRPFPLTLFKVSNPTLLLLNKASQKQVWLSQSGSFAELVPPLPQSPPPPLVVSTKTSPWPSISSKAASKNLPSALFAMRYYAGVGLGQSKDIDKAQDWYSCAVHTGNEDASE